MTDRWATFALCLPAETMDPARQRAREAFDRLRAAIGDETAREAVTLALAEAEMTPANAAAALVLAEFYSPEQPREPAGSSDGGRWVGDPSAYHVLAEQAQAAAESAKGLSARQRHEFADAAASVIHMIPPAGQERLRQNVKGWKFYPDREALNAAVVKILKTGAARESLVAGEADAGGMYDHRTGILHLSEALTTPTAAGLGGDVTNIHHLYAHEIGHALDGPKRELSDTMEWTVPWAGEIVNVNGVVKEGEAKSAATISEYARQSPAEGFAEFARMVYAGSTPHEELEKQFPRCAAYFKEKGLWPKG